MLDKVRKWKDEAAGCMKKKKYSKALQYCQKVLRESPQDFFALQSSGYIHRKLERLVESIDSYRRLVEAYARQGFLLRAIATCKVVLEIDPEHNLVIRKLADLYAMQPDGATKIEVNVMAEKDSDIQLEDQDIMLLSEASCESIRENVQENHPASVEDYNCLDISPTTHPDDLEVDIEIDLEDPDANTNKVVKTLPEIPLFSHLERDAFVAILERMNLIHMKAGDWIVHEGDLGESMFAIARGSVQVLKRVEGSQSVKLAVLREGAFFGEMSILRKDPRGASVQTLEAGELFEISKDLLDNVMEQHPKVKKVLTKFMRQRLLGNVLNTSTLFKPFSHDQKVQILERFMVSDVQPGQQLIREGERSPGLFVVLRGQMDVIFDMDDGGSTKIGVLKEGEVFGEISCLYKKPAVASVIAATQATILRLPREDFQELVLSHSQVLELAANLGEQHLAQTSNTLAKKGILI